MSDWIKINGIHSDALGIWVDTPPIPPMAKRRRTISQIGFDEDVVTTLDSYDNLNITIYFYQIDGFNSSDVYDNGDIFTFISSAQTLEMSRFEGWYYKVIDISAIQPVSQYNANKVKYAATFTVSPFKYKVGDEEIDIDNQTDIINNGTVFSKPIIRFSMATAGNVRINTNGEYFFVNDVPANTQVVIDSTKMIATIGGEIVNASTKGNFPMLNVGNNLVRLSRMVNNSPVPLSGGKILCNTRRR